MASLSSSSKSILSIKLKPHFAIIIIFLIIIITCTFTPRRSIEAFIKTPILPQDLLPLLPHQISWRILTSLRTATDLLPTFVGAASVYNNNSYVNWKGSCFYENTAWLELHNKTGSEFGGGTLHIKVNNAHSWTCMDLYIFVTPYRVKWDYYFLSREHKIEFDEWEGKAEYEYVKHKGVAIFLMEAGMIGTLQALWEVFPLFTNTKWGESSNLAFLEKHMGAKFEVRPEPWVTNITLDDIQSGDFLAISKIRGLWGGFETMEKWASGAYAGHSAVCLRDSEGKLWVGESGHEDEEGRNLIVMMPWDEWWNFELTKDNTNPHIALLPLHPDLRSKFNETAAWEYAQSMVGMPYGYHNLIFGWIDTIDGNYPPPLDAHLNWKVDTYPILVHGLIRVELESGQLYDFGTQAHLVASVMTVWNKLQPDYAANIWNEALNKRLGTQDLDLPEILVEVERRGSSFAELLTIPEQDDWTYVDGKSTSCVAFILEMYKEAGLFGDLANKIQVTEFTIKDAYTLNFFENNSSRLPKWCNNDADPVKLPFCQITGKYRMELPEYNSIEPYPHMAENCPSMAPDYSRPKYC